MTDITNAVTLTLILLAKLSGIVAAVWVYVKLPTWILDKLGPIYRRSIERNYGPQALWEDRNETREEQNNDRS